MKELSNDQSAVASVIAHQEAKVWYMRHSKAVMAGWTPGMLQVALDCMLVLLQILVV